MTSACHPQMIRLTRPVSRLLPAESTVPLGSNPCAPEGLAAPRAVWGTSPGGHVLPPGPALQVNRGRSQRPHWGGRTTSGSLVEVLLGGSLHPLSLGYCLLFPRDGLVWTCCNLASYGTRRSLRWGEPCSQEPQEAAMATGPGGWGRGGG